MIYLYPYSGFSFLNNIKTKLHFANSARSLLFLISKHFKDAIFLIPSYTCHTVLHALKQSNVNYDFVDINNTLNFDDYILNKMINIYKDKQIVLIPTSLFNSNIKNYKKLYPKLVIVEDRAQGVINESLEADFQITSFGKGKMVSSFYGGAIYDKDGKLKSELKSIPTDNDFLKSYLLSIAQKIISRLWFVIENTKYDPETNITIDKSKIHPQKMSDMKQQWILNTLENIDYRHRIMMSNYYLENIDNKYLFNIEKNIPYLRMPIKKNIKFTGVSKLKDFHEVYYAAKEKRNEEQKGAKALVNGSFLPTHNLVTINYAKKLVYFINKS